MAIPQVIPVIPRLMVEYLSIRGLKMKKLLIAVIAVISISMLAPETGLAEPTHFNEIGLYSTTDGFGETGTFVVAEPVDVYLVLTKPASHGIPCTGIKAFECRLNFNPIGGIFKLLDMLMADGLNIGDTDNIHEGYLEYIAAFGGVVPVVDEADALIHFQFLNTNSFPVEVTLSPASLPSLPGFMVFLPPDYSGNDDLEIMYAVSGHPDAPVYIFNGAAVSVETESFGSVKALYR
jgi:hypothetical protein